MLLQSISPTRANWPAVAQRQSRCAHIPKQRPSSNKRGASTMAHALTDVTMLTDVSLPSTNQVSQLAYELDARNGLQRIKYEATGWYYWDWEVNGQKRKVHYIKAGRTGDPVVVLVHGYGASSYHWRYNVPALAEAGYQVYAVDLLGFGYSEKAREDYTNGELWSSQVAAFIREVVSPAAGGAPVVLAGNSLGGYVSLATAATEGPELVRAVALLNGAGPFKESEEKAAAEAAAQAAAMCLDPVAAEAAVWRAADLMFTQEQPTMITDAFAPFEMRALHLMCGASHQHLVGASLGALLAAIQPLLLAAGRTACFYFVTELNGLAMGLQTLAHTNRPDLQSVWSQLEAIGARWV